MAVPPLLLDASSFNRLPRSRAAALSFGSKQYFTGVPCKNGHIALRMTNTSVCLVCRREAFRKWKRDNFERAKTSRRKWRKRHFEKLKTSALKWRQDNPDKIRQYKRWDLAKQETKAKAKVRAINWRKINRAKHRRYSRDWSLKNPEQSATLKQNYRARKKAANGFHTVDDVQRIRKSQRGRCAICSVKCLSNAHLDHIIPLAKGGSNWPNNLQLLCARCNCTKHARDQIEFMRSRGNLL